MTAAWRLRRKRQAELAYWRNTLGPGPTGTPGHYEFLFTTLFGLDREFYAGRSVIDIGCGPRGSLEWAPTTATRVGLDPLADSYREFGTESHEAAYVTGTAEAIPFPDGHFDVLASFNSLDHVEDPGVAMDEFKRVVKPGGLILLIVEVNHPPSATEPHTLTWDVPTHFLPEFVVLSECRREITSTTLYDNIFSGRAYDHRDLRPRPGLLAAGLKGSALSPRRAA